MIIYRPGPLSYISSYSRIIAALAHVDMIVRMYRLLRAQFSAKHLNRTVRNDLRDINNFKLEWNHK